MTLHRPGVPVKPAVSGVSTSQLVPLLSTGGQLGTKGLLVPMMVTLVAVVAMFSQNGNPAGFNAVLSLYLIFASYYVIHRLVGKRKPWWVAALVALTTMLLIVSPVLPALGYIFREVLPGDVASRPKGFPEAFVRHLFGAGLLEELLKALPVLALAALATKVRSPARERHLVCEPLDGVLIGAASGAGFTLLETMGQYVPMAAQLVAQQHGALGGELVGLQLLIPRILGSVFGHIAYSGYLGYFIGLGVLKPAYRWRIFLVGYVSASVLHAFWNASGTLSPLVNVVAGALAYVCLAAAILKARQISPTRHDNFATRVVGMPTAASPVPRAAAPTAAAIVMPVVDVDVTSASRRRFSLSVGRRGIPLSAGVVVRASDLPGSEPSAAQSPLAVVDHKPNDPSVLGLKNVSARPWSVTLPDGTQRTVAPGRSLRLASGVLIDLGSARASVV